MKTIFIATDFSDAARNAGKYGIELAKAFNARIVLFNAWQQVAATGIEGVLVLSWEEYCAYANEQLLKERNIIDPNKEIPIEIAYEEGTATETILQSATVNKADIIIVGMKGNGKMMRRFLGSTAIALANKTNIPLVIVPEEATFTAPLTIALANESDIEQESDPHILNALREIAERFHSKTYLVRVARSRFHEVHEFNNRPFHLQKIMRSLDPQYELLQGSDIAQTLNNFIDRYKVNLLAMFPHKYSALEKIFIKSITRSMAFETHVPLLMLPNLFEEKNINKKTGGQEMEA